MDEPRITVNGQELTSAQAMAVRAALTDFYFIMGEPNALGFDEHGVAITAAYRARVREVLGMMLP
jgi:hypothetical protein